MLELTVDYVARKIRPYLSLDERFNLKTSLSDCALRIITEASVSLRYYINDGPGVDHDFEQEHQFQRSSDYSWISFPKNELSYLLKIALDDGIWDLENEYLPFEVALKPTIVHPSFKIKTVALLEREIYRRIESPAGECVLLEQTIITTNPKERLRIDLIPF